MDKSSGLVAKLTTWQSGLEVQIMVVFLSAYYYGLCSPHVWKKALGSNPSSCVSTLINFDSIHDLLSLSPPLHDQQVAVKLLKKAVFPKNLEVSCAKHIEANVSQRFALKCSQLVYRIARTFSTRYENRLFETMQNTQPAAVRYLLDHMKDIMWSGTSWLDDELAMAPRYGIFTSNTSESVNSMLSDACDVGWLQAVEKIVDLISTKIYRCHQK
jgi:hypothetical protein